MKHTVRAAALLAGCLFTLNLHAQKFDPPTLGWSSWNTFALNITEDVICRQADAMVSTGLARAGYKNINIDDGYWNGRDSNGQLRINTQKFPNGMRAVADYIHKLGLTAGIYSDAGDNTCGSGQKEPWGCGVGLAGYEEADCHTYFIDWDYDFIKVDFCGGNHMRLDERLQYTKISKAIAKTAKEKGKKITFNVCRWAYPGTWISDIADSWRTTGDIYDDWKSVKNIIKENLYIQAYTGGGHYNDMDMMEIGRSMNENEERTHMAYWCIASSPLLIGCDMTTLRQSSLELLTNPHLLAMNQDKLGLGAPVVQREGEVYVVAKDMEKLQGKKRAVVVMNLSDEDKTITVDLSKLEFKGVVSVFDCFTQNRERAEESIRVFIPAHGSQAFLMEGNRTMRHLYEAEEAWLREYQEISGRPTAHPAETSQASKGAYVTSLGNSRLNYLEWKNVYVPYTGYYDVSIHYACADKRALEISVNNKLESTLSSLTTGSDIDFNTVNVTLKLKKGMNTIRLNNPAAPAPNIDCINIR